MLASGDWLVPRVGSEPSLRKPPLLNWAIALSCKFSGGTSEWAVRLPSVLATLALTITIVGVGGGRWLGLEGALVAAIFFLTNITIIETGRLAELEALYISLTGIALVLWMTAWRQGAALWQLWLLPAPFLALGMLTKGPTHLIFYYGIILPVLVFGSGHAVAAPSRSFPLRAPHRGRTALLGYPVFTRSQQPQSRRGLAFLVDRTRFTRVCGIERTFSSLELVAKRPTDSKEFSALDPAAAPSMAEGDSGAACGFG